MTAKMPQLSRRRFLKSAAFAGAGLAAGSQVHGQARAPAADVELKFGIIGCGAQAEALRASSSRINGLRFAAVADIQDNKRKMLFARIRASKMGIGNGGTDCAMYERAEDMLKKENLDGVFIAVPNFLHHRYTNLCLEAGLHVYCEKPMSDTIEGARSMMRAQVASGKLLQIGHQRRSNPAYLHARNRIVHGDKALLGWVTQMDAQWNRSVAASVPRPLPVKLRHLPSDDTLKEFGYGTGVNGVWNLINWRMVEGLGSGVLGDLGCQQIDVFNWFMGSVPRSVFGSSGAQYFTPAYLKRYIGDWAKENQERFDPDLYDAMAKLEPKYDFPDHVTAVYEYQSPAGQWKTAGGDGEHHTSIATCRISSTNQSDGFFEKFKGEHGSLTISEDIRRNLLVAENDVAKAWGEHEQGDAPAIVKPDQFAPLHRATWKLPALMTEPPHTPHVRNFFDTIVKSGTQKDLNCPAEEGFRTAVTVLKTIEAVKKGEKVEITPRDFAIRKLS